MAWIFCSVAYTRRLVTMMTFVLVEIPFKVAVITSSVAKIIFVVAQITLKWR